MPRGISSPAKAPVVESIKQQYENLDLCQRVESPNFLSIRKPIFSRIGLLCTPITSEHRFVLCNVLILLFR